MEIIPVAYGNRAAVNIYIHSLNTVGLAMSIILLQRRIYWKHRMFQRFTAVPEIISVYKNQYYIIYLNNRHIID